MATIDDRMMALEATVAAVADRQAMMGDAVSSMHQHVQLLLATRSEDESVKSGQMRDTVWACENCAARLGIYDPHKDELRVRYKDFVCYVKPGVGGSVRVPCRRCGLDNTLRDTRQTAQTVAAE